MRRVLFRLAVPILCALPMNAQPSERPVRVCVASPICSGSCAQTATSERKILIEKLRASKGKIELDVLDDGFRRSAICTESSHSCDYLAFVETMGSDRFMLGSLSALQTQKSLPGNTPPPLQPSPTAQWADEHQQEPLDQSSIRFHVIRLNGCQQLESKEISKLEVSDVRNPESVRWLAEKAAQRVRRVVERDAKAIVQKKP